MLQKTQVLAWESSLPEATYLARQGLHNVSKVSLTSDSLVKEQVVDEFRQFPGGLGFRRWSYRR